MQAPRFLWITDPWSTLDHAQDTTLRLMQEGVNMGLSTFWSGSDQLLSIQSHDSVQAVEIKSLKDLSDLSKLKFHPVKTSTFQQIHYRLDPPVDEKYCGILDGLTSRVSQPGVILNPPALLKSESEKIPPQDLAAFSPRMLVVKGPDDIRKLTSLFGSDSEIISKPLHLAQSAGVKNTPFQKARRIGVPC